VRPVLAETRSDACPEAIAITSVERVRGPDLYTAFRVVGAAIRLSRAHATRRSPCVCDGRNRWPRLKIDLHLYWTQLQERYWTQLQERLRRVQMRLHAGYAKPFQT
jgi:hypothetical protein